MEDGVGGIVMPLGGQTSGLPDLADGVGTETNDPTGDQDLEGLEDLDRKQSRKGSTNAARLGIS